MISTRSIYLTIFLLPFFSPVLGQDEKGRVLLSAGFQYTYSYTRLYNTFTCFEGCYPTAQQSIPMFVANVSYYKSIPDSRLNMVFGLDVNSKGWEEEGLSSAGSGPPDQPYSTTVKATYLDF